MLFTLFDLPDCYDMSFLFDSCSRFTLTSNKVMPLAVQHNSDWSKKNLDSNKCPNKKNSYCHYLFKKAAIINR